MSLRTMFGLALAATLAACSGRSSEEQLAAADSVSRDLGMPPADTGAVLRDLPAPPAATPTTPAPRPTPPAATPAPAPAPSPAPAPPPAPAASPTSTLAEGTRLELRAGKEITSRTNKAGETFTATVAEAVTDAAGRTVIPAGATVTMLIVAIKPAANRGDSTGTLELRATQVSFGGETHTIDGSTVSVASTLKGRGVTTGDAAKVGAGAAAGAIAGRILGGGSRGTVVGGVVGAAAGAAVAAETADRDVVVAEGARIVIALRDAVTLPRS